MTLLAADIVERFYTFLWPMLRISALMIAAPIFSLPAFNLRLRVLIADLDKTADHLDTPKRDALAEFASTTERLVSALSFLTAKQWPLFSMVPSGGCRLMS